MREGGEGEGEERVLGVVAEETSPTGVQVSSGRILGGCKGELS